MNTQVLFIRHGETDWNRIKRIQEHIDISLAASGVVQVGQLAQRLLQESKAGDRLDARCIAVTCNVPSKRPNRSRMHLVYR